jgi:4-hydroxy-tetrahydrodipicolinate reductase
MNILINGIAGHMGQELARLCEAGCRGARLAGGVDPHAGESAYAVYPSLAELPPTLDIACIVDFSHHTCAPALLSYARERGVPVVIATTGHTEEELAAIRAAATEIPVFFAANMSFGVALLVELAKQAAVAMPEADIEIIEKHHNRKLDAPSGTALMLAEEICRVREGAYPKAGRSGKAKREVGEIGIHAVRLGNIVGEHEVIIGTESQTITLKHEAHSRALFAEGALAAAAFLVTVQPGLYDMKSLVGGHQREAALC